MKFINTLFSCLSYKRDPYISTFDYNSAIPKIEPKSLSDLGFLCIKNTTISVNHFIIAK